ncbi:MAG: aminopeptidase P N-terminal domain-containing protein [Verrucomicrobia bacterium]|nr:aminopeptidase P N-terminal domain-containing protein [Verrucomicrobiota bacterium]
MKYVKTNPELFITNRERLKKLLVQGALVVVNSNDIMPTNADGTMGHQQNSDLYYLTGINQEETILLLCPDHPNPAFREILFLRETNELLTIWEGHKYTMEEAAAISGIRNVRWLSDFGPIFRQLMCEQEDVYLNTNEHYRAANVVQTRDMRFVEQCRKDYPLHRYHRLARLMHRLRVIKSPLEVELIKKACDITGMGFARVLKNVKPGINEAEIEADFAYEFIRHKATFSYLPIIASGADSCVLHYPQNDKTCNAGDVVLMDVGAGYGNYMADMTRTIPVSGRFTKRQREVYDAVLRIYYATRKEMKPGLTIENLRSITEAIVQEECLRLGLFTQADLKAQDPSAPLYRKYFMHGVSHSIGLDVHDVIYPQYQKLEPGWVLTCEPGIYIREEGLGIRLEDTIYISEQGPVNLMEGIPMEADAIEEAMNSK